VAVGPKADNTGFLVHIQSPDAVWPPCVQVQGKHGHVGDMFLMGGAESTEHLGTDANTPLILQGEGNEKPVGDWNNTTILCTGDRVKAIVNGKTMNEVTGCSVSSGCVGVQSEGAVIEIRKMYVEPPPGTTRR